MKSAFLAVMFVIFTCSSVEQTEYGIASFYADSFKGKPTANGEVFNPNQFTAAHRNLPFGTKVKVTNLENEKSVVVRINDRGPYLEERIIDLSPIAAQKLDFKKVGTAEVEIKIVKEETETGEITTTK